MPPPRVFDLREPCDREAFEAYRFQYEDAWVADLAAFAERVGGDVTRFLGVRGSSLPTVLLVDVMRPSSNEPLWTEAPFFYPKTLNPRSCAQETSGLLRRGDR